MSKIAIIGSGFSGLSAAAYLAKEGYEVHVFEKNKTLGGRCRQIKTSNGFTFDMGPSWYWMPDVFEKFFNDFGYTTADLFQLKKLNPAFDIYFGEDDVLEIPGNFNELCQTFEDVEKGSSKQLKLFMQEAELKYKIGMEKLVYKPGLSFSELVDKDILKNLTHLQVFSSFSKHVRKYFSNPKLIALMEFPVLFLGAMPKDTPALYSLMNYAGLNLGTWYPMGGLGKIIDAMVDIAEKNGVQFHIDCPVDSINVLKNKTKSIQFNNQRFKCDGVIASADYQHVEDQLLPKRYRNYSTRYWKNKVFAPSCLIFYLGIKKKLNNINHHTLFFDEDLDIHAKEIYKTPKWPTKPLFYTCCPSKTDHTIAPEGHENIFLLMPIAVDLEDNENFREYYFNNMIKRLEKRVGENISEYIIHKQSYCVKDFIADYNSFRGNAYGLANTLMQTANLKPKIKNKKVKNLIYTGQLTVPGPGVPPSIISGKIAANQLINYLK